MLFGIAHLSCGFLPSMPDEGTKAVFSSIFTGKYQPVYVSDMDGWYKSHLAFILPICYVCYALDCDLTKIRGQQLKLVMDAAGEGYAMLAALGCPVLPEGSEKAFAPGWEELRRAL